MYLVAMACNMAEKWDKKKRFLSSTLLVLSTVALRGENVRKVRLLCRLRANFWLLTSVFSHLLSLTLEAIKNG